MPNVRVVGGAYLVFRIRGIGHGPFHVGLPRGNPYVAEPDILYVQGPISGGYRQRVGIAQAILHKPKIVVLDEPTNGLDPNQIIVVRELIRGIATRNSVILSTHVLSEVQALCSQIIMIELGEIVFSGSLQRFNDQVTPASLSMTAENLPHVDDVLKIDGVSKVEQTAPSSLRVWFEGSRDVANRIVAASVADGWNLLEIRFERSSLDDVFAKLSQSDRRPSVQSG